VADGRDLGFLSDMLERAIRDNVEMVVAPLRAELDGLRAEVAEVRDRRPAPEVDVLIGEEATAQLLGVARVTVRSWRTRGGGPPWVKTGNRGVRYSRADVLEFRSRRTTGGGV